jgi:hypothetical protein
MEEFKLPFELTEKLREHAFNSHTTKTKIVIKALEEYLKNNK